MAIPDFEVLGIVKLLLTLGNVSPTRLLEECVRKLADCAVGLTKDQVRGQYLPYNQ